MAHSVIWQNRFLDLTDQFASWSHDPSTKVGAVLTNDSKHILGMGYNGFPPGICDDPTRYADKALKYSMVLHAEENLLLHCNYPTKGTILYVSHQPCTNCASRIITKGISQVVFRDRGFVNKWGDSLAMFDEAGIEYLMIPYGY